MATIFNEQRRLGVVIVPDGTILYNGRRVIGVRDAGNALFVDNQRVVAVDVIADGSRLYNEQPVTGVVVISDARTMYNGQRITPVTGAVRPDPISILGADLLAWWTADDLTRLGISGGTVYTWRDQVTNKSLSQSTASNRPLYSATSFNGSPGLTFDGSDDVMSLGTHNLTTGAIEQWALVDQMDNPSSNVRMITSIGGTSAGKRKAIERANNTSVNALAMRTPTGNTAETVLTNAAAGDFTGRHAVRAVHQTGQQSIQLDNGTIITQTIIGTATTETSGLSVGASYTPSAYFKGVIRDIIYCNLIPEKRDALWDWMLSRRNP